MFAESMPFQNKKHGNEQSPSFIVCDGEKGDMRRSKHTDTFKQNCGHVYSYMKVSQD